MMKSIIFFLLIPLLIVGANSASAQTINDIQICEGVDTVLRKAIDPQSVFLVGQRAHCFLNFGGRGDRDMTIKVNWYRNENLQYSQYLDLKFKSKKTSRYRTWANKTLRGAGNWKAEIVGEQKEILTSVDFRVIERLKKFPGKQVLGSAVLPEEGN
ncbi:MAG: DUF2914 domain-containing protein [Bacteroidota bacterium]